MTGSFIPIKTLQLCDFDTLGRRVLEAGDQRLNQQPVAVLRRLDDDPLEFVITIVLPLRLDLDMVADFENTQYTIALLTPKNSQKKHGDNLNVQSLQTNFVTSLCCAALFVEICRHGMFQLPKHLDGIIAVVRKKVLRGAEKYVRSRFIANTLFDSREK